MLHNDRHVSLDNAGVIRIAWDRLRIHKIIEAQMQGALRQDGYAIGPDRLAVGEETGNPNLSRTVTRIEDASGLVTYQTRIGSIHTLRRNIPFRNRPAFLSYGFHTS